MPTNLNIYTIYSTQDEDLMGVGVDKQCKVLLVIVIFGVFHGHTRGVLAPIGGCNLWV